MAILMVISIYTSRIVLQALGVNDFGVYNVVGGIVSLVGFLNTSMANAVQRFISFEYGKGVNGNVNQIFSLSVEGHLLIIAIVLILSEILGIWLVNYELDIPAESMTAANWVLQTSIFAALISFIQVPYNALIISKESMGFYAYVSLIEGALRLGIAFTVLYIATNKLILYGWLQLVVSTIIFFVYYIYCNISIPESKFHWVRDNRKFREILSFVSFNLIGEIAWVFTNQGLSIVMNIFCGPVVNAARALATQVNSSVMTFVNNFQQALSPQIIKTYANDEIETTFNIIYRGSKISYYLFFALSLPLMLEMRYVLHLWLTEVPDHTVTFCNIVLIAGLIGVSTNLIAQLVRANGNIKTYQIVCSIGGLISLPIAYLILKYTKNPDYAMCVLIMVQIILFFNRIIMASRLTGMPILTFYKRTIIPILLVSITAPILPLIIPYMLEDSTMRLISTILVSICCVIITSYMIGLDRLEKQYVKGIVCKVLHKHPSNS